MFGVACMARVVVVSVVAVASAFGLHRRPPHRPQMDVAISPATHTTLVPCALLHRSLECG